MSAVALVPSGDAAAKIPANLHTEQALLGCVLYENSAYERVPDRLRPEHFAEPFHQRLWSVMVDLIGKGRIAEPTVLHGRFKGDPAYDEFGGIAYLALLVEQAPPVFTAADLADEVYDLSLSRALLQIGQTIIANVTDGAHAGAAAQVTEAEEMLFALAERGEVGQGFRAFADVVAASINMAAEAYSRDGGLSGVSTGLIDLDRMLGGLHPSDLVILAGRPSMGKTALATNIAFHVAKSGAAVGFFSLEMSAEQLGLRILADAAGVPGDKIRKGEISASEFGQLRDAATEIERLPLHTDATGGLSLGKLAARARRLKRRHGLALIVVDYLQLLTIGAGGSADGRVQEVSAITMGLKALAKELDVPVLALSQLSRQVEMRADKRPQLSDLRESGSIEQDADMVLFVYREEYYLGRTEPREGTPEHLKWCEDMSKVQGVAEVIIGKQRHGPIGTVKLHFNSDLTKFGNLARDGRFEPSGAGFDFKKLSAGDRS